MIKRLVLSFLVLFVLVSYMSIAVGADVNVTLAWDASISGEVAGYNVYHKNFQHPYDYTTPLWTGNALTCVVQVPNDRQTEFVARAFAYGPYDLNGARTTMESGDSNAVIYKPPTTVPLPPRNFVVRILVAIAHFFSNLFG